jgi:hypothetical protein
MEKFLHGVKILEAGLAMEHVKILFTLVLSSL